MKKRSFLLNILLLTTLLLISTSAFSGQEETANKVASAIQAGNAQDVSKYFNAMIDLTVPGYDDIYSKAQAGQILKEFFSQNPVKNFKITKQGSSPDGSQYTIGSLETSKKTYRIYFLVKVVGGLNLVQQFQIQDI
ncbi:MAG: DUF4783 domain-containing protein [Bacteroidetes bacterium]|nr:DUF4783 domain-containing protein [Bacteroidota bacterium]